MGLFDKWSEPQVPIPQPTSVPEHTIETVREHLDAIGQTRLGVRSPDMKVFLTQIAWHGEPYLMRRSPDGQPSGGQLVEFCKQLETVRRVVGEFQNLEKTPSIPSNNLELRVQGETAVKNFAVRLTSIASNTGGSANVTGYVVDTQILSM